jgi:hypothetical protein
MLIYVSSINSNTLKNFNSLSAILDEPTPFAVISSIVKKTDENVFITRLRKQNSATVNGIDVAESKTVTLFVSTRSKQADGEVITIDPALWDYSISEFTPEGSDDKYEIKWLRAK